MNYHFPLVKELPTFEYNGVNVNSYSSIECEDGILDNLSDFFQKGFNPFKIQGGFKFEFVPKFVPSNPKGLCSWSKK
jgi:hypothetical protein